ncbi:hypothetical protein [Streptomyces cahuitamycinicus]|uniref:hypothetical protein n=1 Tax=Streptomyces cahuitamycinicus TaxID=2070367 RepID=UPI0011AEF65D|nr:hypothetical protein [Streptomyces cahuitamycinicus]
MRSPGPSVPVRAYTAGTLLVALCAISTLPLLVMAPAISGEHAVVAPGPSAPDGNTPGSPPLHRAPAPEFRPLPSPGPG